MGLFDFITKTASGNSSQAQQSGQATTTQTYQNGQQDDRLVQTPFSDVKYPLPENQAVPDLYNQPVTDYQYPQLPQGDEYHQGQADNTQVPADLSMSATQRSEVPQQQLDANNAEYLQYNPQFNGQVAPPNGLPADLTEDINAPAGENNNEIQSIQIPGQNELPDLPPLANEVPNVSANNVEQVLPPLPDLQPLNVEESAAKVQEGLTSPLVENPPISDIPTATNSRSSTNTNTENSIQDTLEIGTMNAGEVPGGAKTPEELTASAPMAETIPTVETPIIPEVQSEAVPPAPLVIEETKLEEPKVEEPKVEEPIVKGGPKDEAVDLDKEIFKDIETAVKDEFAKDTEKTENSLPEAQVSNEVEVMPEITTFKVFKNIAFVGLNVEAPDQSMSEKLLELIRMLAVYKPNIVLDSGKGYGEFMLNKLLEHKDISIKGAYLKPFYSDYSDEPKVKVNTDNYSTAMFSNLDSKFKYLIKSADLFIIPETKGISNISMLFSLLSNAYIYFGQHKPIILLGTGWKKITDELKAVLNLSTMEADLFKICETPTEVMSELTKLDADYSTKSKVSVNKVIDMRNEGDESEYFVNNF